MLVLLYVFFGGSALYMIYQDMREQMIPLSGLALFLAAALLKQFWEPEFEGLWAGGAIALILIGCQSFFYVYKGKLALGWGDLILGPCCGLWLQVQELPSFLVSTGIIALFLGIFWRYRWSLRTFPFAPALLFGLGIVFVIRCFLTMNEI